MPVLPSYRNQSIGWFLYEGNLSILWVTQTKYLMERIVSAAAQSFHLNFKGNTNFSNIWALSWIMAFKMVRQSCTSCCKFLKHIWLYYGIKHYDTPFIEKIHISIFTVLKKILWLSSGEVYWHKAKTWRKGSNPQTRCKNFSQR